MKNISYKIFVLGVTSIGFFWGLTAGNVNSISVDLGQAPPRAAVDFPSGLQFPAGRHSAGWLHSLRQPSVWSLFQDARVHFCLIEPAFVP